jgi:manganese transport protein
MAPSQDLSIRKNAADVLTGKSKAPFGIRMLPFLGPAFIAGVAYMDPGNIATNIQAGAQFGYTLLWVIAVSNLMAMVIQSLSAKLGIATGKNLAEHCRLFLPKPAAFGLWIVMEIVAMATDLAEFLGAAVGFQLLFGFPLWIAGCLTAIATMIVLGLERYGFRPLEAVITVFVAVVAVCYLLELFLGNPDWTATWIHTVTPQFSGPESYLLAAGIVGATVMPHAIFLHSALMQNRIVVREPALMRRLFHFEVVDVLIAMGLAGLINLAMLIMAASVFHTGGYSSVGSLEDAYRTLQPLLGPAAGTLFAVSLLASGLSSASVGTMAGQIIMQGFLERRVQPWIRRLITMAPSIVVILIGIDPTRALVLSQVVLSFGIPFALIPLVWLTARRSLMGTLTNHPITTLVACVMTLFVIALNGYLVVHLLMGGAV